MNVRTQNEHEEREANMQIVAGRSGSRPRARAAAWILLAAGVAAGCSRREAASPAGATPASAAATPVTFATPAEAGQALLAAVRAGDQAALTRMFGPAARAVKSGDPALDKATLESFVARYERMNRWVAMTDGSQVLYIGADNFPFPVPLAKDGSRWRFDPAAGEAELRAREIGRDELLAIDACKAIANAEELYFQQGHDGNPPHRYTALILSSPGKQDGLHWETPEDQPGSPLGHIRSWAPDALAPGAPADAPVFDGYRFRILTAQGSQAEGGAKSYLTGGKLTGGFAVLAVPVKYRETGVMTFLLSREGVVYEKDLGEKTSELAAAMQAYDPGEGWAPAE